MGRQEATPQEKRREANGKPSEPGGGGDRPRFLFYFSFNTDKIEKKTMKGLTFSSQ
jgi:hypothetical protein